MGRGQCRICEEDATHRLMQSTLLGRKRITNGVGVVILALISSCSFDFVVSDGRFHTVVQSL